MRALLVLAVLPRAAFADCPPHGPKELPITRGTPSEIDGRLDDDVWQRACFADDFEEKQPIYRAPPKYPVKVAVAVDDTTLYVAARMWSAGPDDIDDALTQRDDTSQAERFIVSIDPSHTRRLAYSFALTASGVRADWIHTDDSESKRDMSWSPVWIGASRILPDGWSCELAIPLSQLRLPRAPASAWGIDFNWYIPHRNEDVFWRAVPPDRTAWASWFGELVDLPPIHPGLALELLPYVATRFVINESEPTAPAHRWSTGVEAGIDAKLRPTPDFVIAATVNPDFGQVDQDPAFVNLSAYEVRLPERRPFFIENNALLSNTPSYDFYSRRIGGLPRTLPAADSIDLPPQVRILGALAAGGYAAPRTQIAALAAVTDETSANALISGQPATLVVSPLTAWAAGRVEHQEGASVFGATGTFVQRALGGTGLAALLPETAFVADTDQRLRTCDGTYELLTYGGATGVLGDPAAITLVEEDSAHYFQRPDQPHVHLDTDAHHLYGWHAGLFGSKRAGPWQGTGGLNFESPGYELNDLGALMSADDIDSQLDLRRVETIPGDTLFGWSAGAGAATSWNFGGVHKPVDVRASGDLTTLDFNAASLGAHFFTPGTSDDLTRGGPRMRIGWAAAATASASTPRGREKQLSGSVEVDVSPTLQQGVIASAALNLRVMPALRLDVTPSLAIFETHRQYVDTLAGGNALTYDSRYVFGHLARKDLALELRATWSLSPDLVFTLYAQPFYSTGHYDQLGELVAAGSDQVRWYAQTQHVAQSRIITDGATSFFVPEPDYDIVSLRSTAVMRWEFRPGSTLFVVWQQLRGGVPAPAIQPAVHTLAVKLAYWFG